MIALQVIHLQERKNMDIAKLLPEYFIKRLVNMFANIWYYFGYFHDLRAKTKEQSAPKINNCQQTKSCKDKLNLKKGLKREKF